MCNFPFFNKLKITIVYTVVIMLQLFAIGVGVGSIYWLALWMTGD